MNRVALLLALLIVNACAAAAPAPAVQTPAAPPPVAAPVTNYAAAASDVMRHIQAEFYRPDDGLYAHSLTARHAEHMWGNGVMFSALLGAARHDEKTYRPLFTRFFAAMDRYWDARVKIPGY